VPDRAGEGTILRFKAILGAACVAVLPHSLFAQKPRKALTWDYGVAPHAANLCPSSGKEQDCIKTFVIAYQTAQDRYTPAATVLARDACKPRKEAGGGWTCTAPLPRAPRQSKKPTVWVVWAVTAHGMASSPSNPLSVP
jgi:hypothetical protein